MADKLTTKDKMLKAQLLIKESKHAEARAILETVNHPRAKEWLDKLPAPAPSKLGWKQYKWVVLVGLLIVLVIVGVLLSQQIDNLKEMDSQAADRVQQEAIEIEQTVMAEASYDTFIDLTTTAIVEFNLTQGAYLVATLTAAVAEQAP